MSNDGAAVPASGREDWCEAAQQEPSCGNVSRPNVHDEAWTRDGRSPSRLGGWGWERGGKSQRRQGERGCALEASAIGQLVRCGRRPDPISTRRTAHLSISGGLGLRPRSAPLPVHRLLCAAKHDRATPSIAKHEAASPVRSLPWPCEPHAAPCNVQCPKFSHRLS